MSDILVCGEIYSRLILSTDDKTKYTNSLTDLSRIQGAPSYLLLMYLFKNQATLEVADADILETIKLLTRFFVRRNITDTPNTRDLNKIFMQIISDVEEGNSPELQSISISTTNLSVGLPPMSCLKKNSRETFTKRMLALQDSFSALLLRNT